MSDDKKLPRPPKKLATIEDVSRYMTTITKMLHDDLISPPKANALRSLCIAKLETFKRNQSDNGKVVINIGLAMGSGKKAPIKISGKTDQHSAVDNNNHKTIDEELSELELQIEEVLQDD